MIRAGRCGCVRIVASNCRARPPRCAFPQLICRIWRIWGPQEGHDERNGMIGSNVRGLYTVIEAARLLGVGRSTMYELGAPGRGVVAAFGPQGVDHACRRWRRCWASSRRRQRNCWLAGKPAVDRRADSELLRRRRPGCRWSRSSLIAARRVWRSAAPARRDGVVRAGGAGDRRRDRR